MTKIGCSTKFWKLINQDECDIVTFDVAEIGRKGTGTFIHFCYPPYAHNCDFVNWNHFWPSSCSEKIIGDYCIKMYRCLLKKTVLTFWSGREQPEGAYRSHKIFARPKYTPVRSYKIIWSHHINNKKMRSFFWGGNLDCSISEACFKQK